MNSSYSNTSDHAINIIDHMATNAIQRPDSIIFDSQIHRFGPKKIFWYIAHSHPLAICIYGDWKKDSTFKYIGKDKPNSSSDSRKHIQEEILLLMKSRRNEKNKLHKLASKNAQSIFAKSRKVTFHEYLKNKQVLPLGIKIDQYENLLVPVTDGSSIYSLQFITPNGKKWFLKNGKVKGHYYFIKPTIKPELIYIAEGFATAATLHMETKTPVVVAFNATNLTSVAKNIRKKYPGAEILICGDNDHATNGNPGKTSAIAAAKACHGKWTIPDFTGLNPTKKQTDFNDLYLMCKEARDG